MNFIQGRRWNNEAQLTVVKIISEAPGMTFTIRMLAERLSCVYTTVNTIIKKLIKEGYVIREEGTEKRETGRPRILYRVSEDQWKLEELRAFFRVKKPPENLFLLLAIQQIESRLNAIEEKLDKLFVELKDIRELLLAPMEIIRR